VHKLKGEATTLVMSPRIVIARFLTIRPRNTAIGLATVFALTMLFCPWMWKGLPDGYFPYSGTVVEKGQEFHWITGESHWYPYMIIEDRQGRRTKKYLTEYQYAVVKTGTFVVKKRGFETPLQPGQKSYSELLHELEEQKKQKQSQ
jgi:hypothetical protein